MKRAVILILLLVLTIPISTAVEIGELFEIQSEEQVEEITSGEPGVITYFYTGNKLLATKEYNSQIEYQYQDRLGSDINTKTLPFGQEISSENRFSFTGKEIDKELYYFGARYYDSDSGKFTSIDPVQDQPAYQYVFNNPMNLVDPNGKTGLYLSGAISFVQNYNPIFSYASQMQAAPFSVADTDGQPYDKEYYVNLPEDYTPAQEKIINYLAENTEDRMISETDLPSISSYLGMSVDEVKSALNSLAGKYGPIAKGYLSTEYVKSKEGELGGTLKRLKYGLSHTDSTIYYELREKLEEVEVTRKSLGYQNFPIYSESRLSPEIPFSGEQDYRVIYFSDLFNFKPSARVSPSPDDFDPLNGINPSEFVTPKPSPPFGWKAYRELKRAFSGEGF